MPSEPRGNGWLCFWWAMAAALLIGAWMALADGRWLIALALAWAALMLTDPDEVFRA